MAETGPQGHLHLFAGKMASGKSTLAKNLAATEGAILISEDQWLADLFGDHMATIADYVTYSAKLRHAVEPLLGQLLAQDLPVILDFAANTFGQRRWMKAVIDRTSCAHSLHFLDLPDTICKQRLLARNASGEHAFAPTEAQFDQMTKHFEPPQATEGFTIIHHTDFDIP
ncbi:AAA family ATPase [Cohaesibacter intestini]|uniref:AAA family ATPase n=1 Tax=Cohaesibacter intestini TaxID=2211145 RepID=UPI000DEB81E4|nr:ATP-binding protein [Cohaesibacter intestini]